MLLPSAFFLSARAWARALPTAGSTLSGGLGASSRSSLAILPWSAADPSSQLRFEENDRLLLTPFCLTLLLDRSVDARASPSCRCYVSSQYTLVQPDDLLLRAEPEATAGRLRALPMIVGLSQSSDCGGSAFHGRYAEPPAVMSTDHVESEKSS